MSVWRRPGRDRAGGVLMAVVLAVGAFVFWYRATYNVLPGQGASARVHWCGRDYKWPGGSRYGGPCATVVYLQTAPGRFRSYVLEGAP